MPPPPVDHEAWARKNVYFRPERSDFPGYYNPANFPFFTEILKALSPEDPCRTVSFQKSAQLGGTILALIYTCSMLEQRGGDFMYITPTLDNAKRWSKSKYDPFVADMPAFLRRFPKNSRENTETVLRKDSTDGLASLLISGANSPAALSMESRPFMVLDDLAKWVNNDAGDPEGQAQSRAQAFAFAKIFKVSTPMLWPGCRITNAFKAGSQEDYHVPCPHCGHEHTLEFENFKEKIDPERPGCGCFSCPECGGLIEEQHRPQMLMQGRWIARNPKVAKQHRSFKIWSAYSLLQSFAQIETDYLEAQGDNDKLQRFMNDVIGEPLEVEGTAPDWEKLQELAGEIGVRRGIVPDGYHRIYVGCDCQQDRVEWLAVAYGPDQRRAVIDHGTIAGHIGEATTRDGLDAVQRRKWRNAHGVDLPVSKLAIDGGYSTEDVFGWIRQRRHRRTEVIMVHGATRHEVPIIAGSGSEYTDRGRKRKRRPWQGWLFTLAVSKMKLSLYRALRENEDWSLAGSIAFPSGLDDEFYEQLTAEAWLGERNKKTGRVEYRWTLLRERNEVLDMMNYANGAAIHDGIRNLTASDWEALMIEQSTPPEGAQSDIDDLLGAAPPSPQIENLVNPTRQPPRPSSAPLQTRAGRRAERRTKALAERAARRGQ